MIPHRKNKNNGSFRSSEIRAHMEREPIGLSFTTITLCFVLASDIGGNDHRIEIASAHCSGLHVNSSFKGICANDRLVLLVDLLGFFLES